MTGTDARAGEGRPRAASRRSLMPRTRVGWWAVAASVVGMGSWIVLPMITGRYHDIYPITNSWVMPLIGLVLIDLAAILDGLVIWRWKDRSILGVALALLVFLAALLITLIVVGEALSGS